MDNNNYNNYIEVYSDENIIKYPKNRIKKLNKKKNTKKDK